jgi:hypothetical protein
MNPVLVKTLAASVPACMVFVGSAVLFFRDKSGPLLLQFLGAGFLMVVLLTHICEAAEWFPWMHWGLEHSVGHYVDLSSAILGLTLFPAGYLVYALSRVRH